MYVKLKASARLLSLPLLLAVLAAGALSCGGETVDRGTSLSPDAGKDGSGAVTSSPREDAARRAERLEAVDTWFYYLSFDPEKETFARLAASSYDMVVLEPVFTESQNTDFDIAAVVQNLHGAAEPKLVIAYIDIGQAEEWRTYWQDGWRVGDPDWIVGEDPDGWEGNYPVAFWRDEWKSIWLADDGYLQRIIDAGFDGVYLDWVEAYDDENVVREAGGDGVYAAAEMMRWVGEIAAYGREHDPQFIVIAQNAAQLAGDDEYAGFIDAIAQEQVWFDGGADNVPAGDCPLPRTEADIESAAYVAGLSAACRRLHDEFPTSTLHVSSESYIEELGVAQEQGLKVFTVDYAVDPVNVAWVYSTARGLGFVPFVGGRGLSDWVEPVA